MQTKEFRTGQKESANRVNRSQFSTRLCSSLLKVKDLIPSIKRWVRHDEIDATVGHEALRVAGLISLGRSNMRGMWYISSKYTGSGAKLTKSPTCKPIGDFV